MRTTAVGFYSGGEGLGSAEHSLDKWELIVKEQSVCVLGRWSVDGKLLRENIKGKGDSG